MQTNTRTAASRRCHFSALGLMLGAALALAAGCSSDSGGTTPAPAPAPTPAPPTPAPVGVPGGLKVTATGPEFLEFGWEAVEGATGYEIQLSLKADDFMAVETATVTTTMHRFTVPAETTGYARVRANEGDRQSEWSETAMGLSEAAPLTLAVPVPTMSDSGPDFIEWSWEPVADAAAYEVQVAATADGLAAATAERIETTTHRVAADPETEMFLRVRAVAGTEASPAASDWSRPVAGRSEVARSPFVVSMTPPGARVDPECSGQAFCPDSETDPKKAMASPNSRMEVSSSHPVRVTPQFVEGASGLSLPAGAEQTPFGRVTWTALQSVVAREGATFRFDRLVVGAAQGASSAADTVYITCGPFRCSEAAAAQPPAPDLTVADSAVCGTFQTDFTLKKGIAQNQGADTQRNAVDAGWEYTLSHPATLVHEFTDLGTAGVVMRVPGAPLEVSSKPVSLSMRPASEPSSSGVNKFGPVGNRDSVSNVGADPGPIWNGYFPNGGAPRDCAPESGGSRTYAAVNESLGDRRGLLSRVERPVNCFALLTDAIYELPTANQPAEVPWLDYVAGYRLQVTPSTAVSWAGSRVAWGSNDPFASLQCEPVTVEVAEQMDACADFQKEAENYWGAGIGRDGQFEVQFRRTGTTNSTAKITHLEIRNKADAPDETNPEQIEGGAEYRPDNSRHTHLWLVNAEDGVRGSDMGIDGTRRDHDLYDLSTTSDGREEYGSPLIRTWRALMRVGIEDDDGDPSLYGDFGKIDMEDAAGDPGSDGVPENYDLTEDPDLACTDADGDGCDAEADFEFSATFTRLRDTDSCLWTAELSLTCKWDADGDRRRGGDTAFTDATIDNFISCRAN